MDDFERGWVSALIDGEGCLTWDHGWKNKERFYPQIAISNTNIAILQRAQSLLGGGTIRENGGSGHKTCFQLKISPKYWQHWLNTIPLIEKETKRQEFLYWLMTDHRRIRKNGQHPIQQIQKVLA